jgi:ribosomal protein L37E
MGLKRFAIGGLALTAYDKASKRRAQNASTELQRSCNRCGHEWYLSHKQAKEKAPKSSQMGLASFGSLVGNVKQRNAQASRLTALELKKQRVEAASACPGCGSQSYTEQVVAT